MSVLVTDTWYAEMEAYSSPAPGDTGGSMRRGDLWKGADGGIRRVIEFKSCPSRVGFRARGRVKWAKLSVWNRWAANATKTCHGRGEEAPWVCEKASASVG